MTKRNPPEWRATVAGGSISLFQPMLPPYIADMPGTAALSTCNITHQNNVVNTSNTFRVDLLRLGLLAGQVTANHV